MKRFVYLLLALLLACTSTPIPTPSVVDAGVSETVDASTVLATRVPLASMVLPQPGAAGLPLVSNGPTSIPGWGGAVDGGVLMPGTVSPAALQPGSAGQIVMNNTTPTVVNQTVTGDTTISPSGVTSTATVLAHPVTYSALQLDSNSLVSAFQDWPETYLTTWAGSTSFNERLQSPTYGDVTWVNPGANALSSLGISAQEFTLPPGCTSITAGFTYVQDGVHTPTGFTWVIHDNASSNVYSSATLTPTSSPQTATSGTVTGLTAGAQYYLIVFAYGSSQSSFLAYNFHVTPNNATGMWSTGTPFVRKRIGPEDYQRDATPNDWYLPVSSPTSLQDVHRAASFSYVEYVTDATTMGGEVWADNTYSTAGLRVDVNGSFNQYVTPGVVGSNVQSWTLPAGLKRVRVTVGARSRGQGTWLRALYFPSAAMVQAAPVQQPKNTRKVIFFGDSITVALIGATGSNIGDRSGPNLVATSGYVEPLFEAYGGAALSDNCNTQANADAFVQSLPAEATDFWSTMGANDYISATGSASTFQGWYVYLLSALQAYRPDLHVWVNSPLPETVETANSAGSTLPNYRTAAQNACSMFRCSFVDGTSCGITSPGDLAGDGVHPNDFGHAKWAGKCIQPNLQSLPSSGQPIIREIQNSALEPMAQVLWNGAPIGYFGDDPGAAGSLFCGWGPMASGSVGSTNWAWCNDATQNTWVNAPQVVHVRIAGAEVATYNATTFDPATAGAYNLGATNPWGSAALGAVSGGVGYFAFATTAGDAPVNQKGLVLNSRWFKTTSDTSTHTISLSMTAGVVYNLTVDWACKSESGDAGIGTNYYAGKITNVCINPAGCQTTNNVGTPQGTCIGSSGCLAVCTTPTLTYSGGSAVLTMQEGANDTGSYDWQFHVYQNKD